MLNLENIKCLGHSTIKINYNEKIIYIDPYRIEKEYQDADIIFITHDHYDHFSEEDILKVKNERTKIIITKDLYYKTKDLGFNDNQIIQVEPNHEYKIENIKINTISSYNIDKEFHLKDKEWVGYIIKLDNVKYYIAGDTDITIENKQVKCDIAFLPVGGKFTMNSIEAANLANIIKPKVVIPIHYGIIVGTKEDALEFQKNIDSDIKCMIMY